MNPVLRLSVFVACLSFASCGPKQEDVTSQPDLSARLEELRIVTMEPFVMEVDFVLANKGPEPILITERWNSWGAYHWSLQLTDAAGSIVKYGNPQRFWTRNFFTTVTIEPGKEHRTNCLLTLTQPAEHRTDIHEFRTSKDVDSVVLPATLMGTFSSPEIQKDGEQATNWVGMITTQPIQLTNPTDQEPEQDVVSNGEERGWFTSLWTSVRRRG